MKTAQHKNALLEHLKKMPIVQVACDRAHVARSTFYRWRKINKKFAKAVEEAIAEGETLITEMSESQLISLIKDRNFSSIHLWLKAHHPKYGNKVEIINQSNSDEELTPEQAAIVREALRLSSPDQKRDQ